MPKYIFLFLFCALDQIYSAQKPFVGSLEYHLITVDFISKDTTEGKLFIYALDSLVRYNYLMADGKNQESIHHLKRKKLLSLIEIDGQFFAVQIVDSLPENNKLDYKVKRGKINVNGLICKEAIIENTKGTTPLLYTKTIASSYFVGLKGAPGLPVKGQIPTDTGYMAFELRNWNERTPPIQLFIPDKKYKVLPLETFLEQIQTQNSTSPQD
jgi:hypothetical protein